VSIGSEGLGRARQDRVWHGKVLVLFERRKSCAITAKQGIRFS